MEKNQGNNSEYPGSGDSYSSDKSRRQSKKDMKEESIQNNQLLESPLGSDEGFHLPQIKVIKGSQQLMSEMENEYAVSPGTPLLSTDIEENGWACGNNTHGQLGIGNCSKAVNPKPLQACVNVSQPQGARRWATLDFGPNHGAGISSEGRLYTWGNNNKGQLGHEHATDVDQPMLVEQSSMKGVRSVACGKEHTVVITQRDSFSFGSNSHGQLGSEQIIEGMHKSPLVIKQLKGCIVSQVVCGLYHTLIVTAQSTVYSWGRNECGQLGLGDLLDRRKPTVVDALWALPVQQIAAGDSHSMALTTNGFLFTWGDNSYGQLGQPPNAEAAAISSKKYNNGKRRGKKKVHQKYLQAMIDMGIKKENAELALIETSNVGVEFATEWLFSSPDEVIQTRLEELADTPTKQDDPVPEDKQVPTPKRVVLTKVQHIAAGGFHTAAATESSVHTWGLNSQGQLGLGTQMPTYNLPQKVIALNNKGITQVACGASHTLFLSNTGAVYGCGDATNGQLGHLTKVGGGQASSSVESDSEHITRVPVVLKLPFNSGSKGKSKGKLPLVSQVVAGGQGSAFLTRAADELPTIQPYNLWDKLQNAIKAAKAQDPQQPHATAAMRSLVTAIDMVFGSAAALCTCFCTRNGYMLDYVKLDQVQSEILELYRKPSKGEMEQNPDSFQGLCNISVMTAMSKSLQNLLDDLYLHVKLVGMQERAQLLLAAAQHPLFGDHQTSKQLLPKLCTTILNAPSATRALLIKWWSEYQPDLLESRVVKPLQQYLTKELMTTKKLTVSVMNAIKVLSRVVESNQQYMRLPPEAFYNNLISEKMDVLDHYVAWRQTCDQPEKRHGSEGPFSFCSYPFLLDAKAKSKLLHTEARIQMEQTVAQARMEHMFSNTRKDKDAALVLATSRKSKPEEQVKDKRRDEKGSRKDKAKSNQRFITSFLMRRLFNQGKDGEGPSGADESTDNQRRRIARELGSPRAVDRTNSMNLPVPEQCQVPPSHPDMCILRVRRTHLVEDALTELARQYEKDLWKPLRVHFIGEDGIDAGGVKKEFFQLLMQELLDPDYGLLQYLPESRTYWFCEPKIESEAKADADDLYQIGLLIGLAIYNGVILDCPLPLALYKKLLHQNNSNTHQKPGLRDLELMQPTLGKSLREVLDQDSNVPIEMLCLTFALDVERFDKVVTIPLEPNGESTPVTEDNRQRYAELYVDYLLNKSVEKQFIAFARGFMKLFHGPAISLFNAQELERLVCGNPNLDFSALEKHAKYDGGFSKETQAVQWLWTIVREFNQMEQRCFLKFFTGSDRAPIGGLGNMKCVIQRDGPDSWKLPTSHTCFNTLLLPEYESKEKMEDRLKLAILNAEGFGLE